MVPPKRLLLQLPGTHIFVRKEHININELTLGGIDYLEYCQSFGKFNNEMQRVAACESQGKVQRGAHESTQKKERERDANQVPGKSIGKSKISPHAKLLAPGTSGFHANAQSARGARKVLSKVLPVCQRKLSDTKLGLTCKRPSGRTLQRASWSELER